MLYTLEELAAQYPAMRRYLAQGFQLCRPVLSLELDIDIETINQRLRVNVETTDVRSIQAFAG